MAHEDVFHQDGARRLAAAHQARNLKGGVSDSLKKLVQPWTEMSHFSLWVATRLADPTFKNIMFGGYAHADPEWAAVATPMYDPNLMIDLSGQYGVAMGFLTWSGFQ